ncbi:MAG TPA: hypothetical protein VGY48_06580 [Vicinamibacterales bacterium]|jgi:hypothetical protein|nr:hypothetical protein [Vicinamibacterales bacterium]
MRRRRTDDIYAAVQQFDAGNSEREHLNVVACVDYDQVCGLQDVQAVLTGKVHTDDGSPDPNLIRALFVTPPVFSPAFQRELLFDALGGITVGNEGTLIALERNPLTDVSAVQRVRAGVNAGRVGKQPRR